MDFAADAESYRITDTPLHDASEQAAYMPSRPIYRQVTAGGYRGRIRELRLEKQRFVVESQNQAVLKQGALSADSCVVSFARSTDAAGRFSEYPILSPAVYYCPGGTEFDIRLSGNTEVVLFCFNQADFLADAMALNEEYWAARSHLLFLSPVDRITGLSAFADAISLRLHGGRSGSPAELQQLFRCMTANALAAFAPAATVADSHAQHIHVRRRALGVVRRAREYIDHELDSHECPTIVDLCRQTGVSQRRLQYCFLDVLGLTPIGYLRIARLHRARAELRDPGLPDLKVGDVAARWGFWHLSKFAGDYRQLFGELPSETLRPRRAG